jgi:hypothetical protein
MRTSRVVIAFLGTLLAMPIDGTAGASDGQRRAILVGVNQYDHQKFKSLRYSVNDVTALAPFLRQAGYDVELLTDDEAVKDPERRPTLANIRARLQAAIHRSKRTDTLLIGLAGHGLQFGGDRDSYFCPADAKPTERASLLSLGQLFRDLDECGGTKLVLVDACRDDPAVGRGIDGGGPPFSSRTRSPRCSVAPRASGRSSRTSMPTASSFTTSSRGSREPRPTPTAKSPG